MKIQDQITALNKKHIIFDFDGVIYSLDWYHGEDLDDYRKRLRDFVAKEIDPKILDFADMKTTYAFTNLAIKRHGQKAKDLIFDFYKEKELTLVPTAKPHVQNIDFIKANKGKYNFFIWSNNHTDVIRELLRKAEIEDHFGIIVGREMVEISKPDPEGFSLINKNPEWDLKDFVMIGDSLESDKVAAETVGIDFIHYR